MTTEHAHRWFVPSSHEPVILSNCLDCPAKQWQPNDGMTSLKQANELNKKNGYPIIPIKSKLRADGTLKNPAGRLQLNKVEVVDMSSKYDHLIPTILADLKTMNLRKCEKKNGFPVQTLSSMLKIWKGKGLLPADYRAPSQYQSPIKKAVRNFEKEKDAILADYRNPEMTLVKMLHKWHISTERWQHLKKEWNVQPKGYPHRKKPEYSRMRF